MQGHVYIPDGVDLATALARTTHLGVGAHADDLEFMAWHPILHCHDREDAWFAAVTVSDGRGSPRSGPYREFSDDQMRDVRLEEQRAAARLGRYSVLYCLDYPSAVIRDGRSPELRADLSGIIDASAPRELYTHNPADRHATHTALACAVIDAARAASHRPERLYGCEVWRGLDWLPDPLKTRFDVSAGIPLMEAIMAVFASQIGGGKRYDLATVGRKRANATYLASHDVDAADALEYALDMTELLRDARTVREYVRSLTARFAEEIDGVLEGCEWK